MNPSSQATRMIGGSIENPIPQEAEQNVGQTTSHTEYFKANRKKKSKKADQRTIRERKTISHKTSTK
ncbi:MAG: hypothetical protein WBIAU1_09530 [Wolbachia endosymbiont of Drosophila biauraria]|nr:MAG: hypothetical protein WBIAU1_09530 [Wolbachia endosymbiont of Drosophila biauraria]